MSTHANNNDSAAPPPGDEVQAAEYVLGVLDEVSRRRVSLRLASDAGFARLVEGWERHFSPWLLRAPATEPSAHVWEQICERLGWREEPRPAPRLWDNAPFWRRAAGIALVAGIVATVFSISRTPPTAPPEEFAAGPVTVLARGDGTTGWIARINPSRGEVLLMPVPGTVDAAGRVNELWIIPAGGKPHSLGLLSHELAHTITVPSELRASLVAGATLAVTLEDRAGIPHAAPSSEPVAIGNIRTI
ncbi:MAG: anti-sigma factor [Rhodanobacteraceae bacterium]|nr:anti-sigma factor [Rhodanobacteraceae bacterium]